MSNQSNEAKFFDLHTTGIGYLNRIREVSPARASPSPVSPLQLCTARLIKPSIPTSTATLSVLRQNRWLNAASRPLKPKEGARLLPNRRHLG